MKSEKLAIKKLKNENSKVSCHYFIKKNGIILNMVPDSYISWHAGISNWKKQNKINKYSIGLKFKILAIQMVTFHIMKNKSVQLNFSQKKISKKFNICKKNFLGHSDISPNRKKDPGEKFPWEKLSKNIKLVYGTLLT